MNIYPAVSAKLGNWKYYIAKMTAQELSRNVQLAHDIYEDRTLGEAIQRILKTSRVNKEIVEYLKRQEDHFFSSIVIAALKGDPKFYQVEIKDDPKFQMIKEDGPVSSSFGVLKFDGSQSYYALDGQHRLAAIKTLLDRSNPLSDGAPENFKDEEFSVILVLPSKDESQKVFMQKYRRLFANLNRYAKPMDQTTNIIMDEDDPFAIITRRLIGQHKFFSYSGRQRESKRIKTEKKGKNVNSGDPYFTSIEALYAINIALLSSRYRENNGWGADEDNIEKKLEMFKRFRPQEDYIDSLFEELILYWDAILKEIPDLHSDPHKMRNHDLLDEEDDEGETDHLLFWPIGQEMVARIVRELLDRRLSDPEKPTASTISNAIKGLGKMEWRLHQSPWKYLLLIKNARDKWIMRNEERNAALRIGQIVCQWLIGLDQLDETEIKDLKRQWASLLIPAQQKNDIDAMWEETKKIKNRISG